MSRTNLLNSPTPVYDVLQPHPRTTANEHRNKVLLSILSSGLIAFSVSYLWLSTERTSAQSLYLSSMPRTVTTQSSSRPLVHLPVQTLRSSTSSNTDVPFVLAPQAGAESARPVSAGYGTAGVAQGLHRFPGLVAGVFAVAVGTLIWTTRKLMATSAPKVGLEDVAVDKAWCMSTIAARPEVPMQDVFENYKTGYQSVTKDIEDECWLEVTQGKIPEGLVGTLLRNGPALFERGGQKREYLDGDGMISQVAVKDGKVHFKSRFVGTDSFKREEEAGRFTDMTIFTAEDPRPEILGGPIWLYRLRDDIFGGPPSPKNNGAYNALHWAGKTMAIDWGRPWALDNDTLEVVGDGKTDALSKINYTAHYRIMENDDGTSTIVFFNPHTDWAKYKSTVSFYEFDEQGNQLSSKVVEFDATYFHDLIVTDNYYVLFDCPIKMDYGKAFVGYPLGKNSLGNTVSEDTDKAPLFRIYPRRGNGEPIFVESPYFCYAFHHVNGFDDGKKMVFDTCTWDRFTLYFTDIVKPDGKEFYPKTKMSRFVIDLEKGTCERKVIHETPCEYPVVGPKGTGKPYQHSYMCTSAVKDGEVHGPLQAITKVSMKDTSVDCAEATLESWVPGDYKFSMEPVFAQRPGAKAEDDGWILSLIHDGTPGNVGTDFVVLDAQNVEQGPIATCRLPHYVPIGVHGSFTPEYLGPATA